MQQAVLLRSLLVEMNCSPELFPDLGVGQVTKLIVYADSRGKCDNTNQETHQHSTIRNYR